MEFLPFTLVIISSISHALWNYLAKDSGDKEAFMLLLNISSTMLFMPIFYILIPEFTLPSSIIPFLVASGVAETLYFVSLGKAYESGDLSIVYPLARSSPMFVAIAAALLLEETITNWGITGIIIVVIGVYVLHLKSFTYKDLTLPIRSFGEPATVYALLASLGTTVYSISDKKGVTIVNPVLYSFWLGIVITSIMSVVIIYRKGLKSLKIEMRGSSTRILVSGFLMKGGYLLVLVALSLAQVSYILSIRQISVVLGTLLGLRYYKEEHGTTRFVGAFVIFVGVYILGVLA